MCDALCWEVACLPFEQVPWYFGTSVYPLGMCCEDDPCQQIFNNRIKMIPLSVPTAKNRMITRF
jgi:hypothetical protein